MVRACVRFRFFVPRVLLDSAAASEDASAKISERATASRCNKPYNALISPALLACAGSKLLMRDFLDSMPVVTRSVIFEGWSSYGSTIDEEDYGFSHVFRVRRLECD